MMRQSATLTGIVLGAALLVAWTGAAQVQDTQPKSSVGGKVDSAVQSLKKGAHEASEAVRQQYEKARTSIHNMGVASRVYGRLHWDKALTDAKVDVDVRRDGVATLTGTVSDPVARAKAIELTRDTVGVSSVVDRLTIQTTTSPSPVGNPAAKP